MKFFQSYSKDLSYAENFNDKFEIYCWGHDEDSNSTLVRIKDYVYEIMLEFPIEHIIASKQNPEYLGNFYTQIITKSGITPVSIKKDNRRKTYEYQLMESSFQRIQFKNNIHAKCFVKHLNILDKGKEKIKVHETKISPIRKLFTNKDIEFSQWMTGDFLQVTNSDDKVSFLDREYVVNWSTLRGATEEENKALGVTKPLVCSYDIEVYSNDHNKFPDALEYSCEIYMISLVVKKLNNGTGPKHDSKFYLLTTLPTNEVVVDDKKTEVIDYENEKALILGFFKMIKKINPDVLTGYNLNFDNEYIMTRCKKFSIIPSDPGRLQINNKAIYQLDADKQFFNKSNTNFFMFPGIMTLDVYPYMKKNYSTLLKHTLDFVSKHFLGDKKHEVTAKMMFRIYKDYKTIVDAIRYMSLPYDERAAFLENFVPSIQDAYENITAKPTDEELNEARKEYTKVAAYCVKDSELPISLIEKEVIWIGQTELANIMGTDVENLLTDGEQTRCVSQLYNLFHKEGFAYTERENKSKMPSEGGHVSVPIKGLHKMVHLLDYMSLYPSIIMAYNLCYSTLVTDKILPKVKDNVTNLKFSQQELEVPKGITKPAKGTKRANEMTKNKDYNYNWISNEVYVGLLPKLMSKLLTERKAVKKEMKQLENEDPNANKMKIDRLNARQLGLKIAANSVYGFLNVRLGGRLPFAECAQSITYCGRNMIITTGDMAEEYGGIVTYGDTDSIFVKFKNEDIVKWSKEQGEERPYSIELEFEFIEWLCKKISNSFPQPTVLEHEQTFWRVLHLCKKKYCGVKYDPKTKGPKKKKDGTYDLYIKGMISEKRENAPILKTLYVDLLKMIIFEGDDGEVGKGNVSSNRSDIKSNIVSIIWMLFSRVLDILDGKYAVENFVKITKYTGNFKAMNTPMAVFGAELTARGSPAVPGEMIEYIISFTEEQKKHLIEHKKRDKSIKAGATFRRVEEVKANPGKIDIDYIGYIEKFSAPLDDIFNVAYSENKDLKAIKIQKAHKKGEDLEKDFINLTTPMKYISYILMIKESIRYNTNESYEFFVESVRAHIKKWVIAPLKRRFNEEILDINFLSSIEAEIKNEDEEESETII